MSSHAKRKKKRIVGRGYPNKDAKLAQKLAEEQLGAFETIVARRSRVAPRVKDSSPWAVHNKHSWPKGTLFFDPKAKEEISAFLINHIGAPRLAKIPDYILFDAVGVMKPELQKFCWGIWSLQKGNTFGLPLKMLEIIPRKKPSFVVRKAFLVKLWIKRTYGRVKSFFKKRKK